MDAIRHHAFGPPEVLTLEQVPDPVAGQGEVLVDAVAHGVHLLDTSLRRGEAGPPLPLPSLPTIPGREIAGTVSAVGPGVAASWVGQRVAAHLGAVPDGGGYARRVVVGAEKLHRIPDGPGGAPLDPADAIAMIGTGRMAVYTLDIAAVTAADVVVVTGAAGGLGTLFVQESLRVGARVVALAGSAARLGVLSDLVSDGAAGARRGEDDRLALVDYSATDWVATARASLEGSPATLVLDGVGGDQGSAAASLLSDAPAARLVAYGWASGTANRYTTWAGADRIDPPFDVRYAVGPDAPPMGEQRPYQERALALAGRDVPRPVRRGRAGPPRPRGAPHHRQGGAGVTAELGAVQADPPSDPYGTSKPDTSKPDTSSPGALSRRAQRTVLAGMIALCSLGAFESLAVTTAMPTVAVELGGLRYYTLAFAVAFATSVVGMLAAGRWCDRNGPTPAMWTGVVLFVVGLVVAGTATGMGSLIAGRAVQGIGSGLFGVALYVLIARVFSADRRPGVFSAFAAAWVVPAIVGPGIAGLVVDHAGWRWVFLGAAVLTVPAAVLMRPGLTAAHRQRTETHVDRAERASRQSNDSLRHAARLAVAVLRAARGLPAVISVRALVSAAFTGAEVLLPLLLVHERHLSPGGAGLILTVGALGWSAASWVRGRDLLHMGHTGYLRLGGALIALGMVGATILVLPDVPAGIGMAFWVLSGSGMGMAYPTLSVLTLDLAPPHEQGSASSALQVADSVAAAIASSATGALLWALYDVAGLPAYAVVLGMTAALAAAAVLLAGRTRVADRLQVT